LLRSYPQRFIIYPQSATAYQQVVTGYPQVLFAVFMLQKIKTTGLILPNRWFVERAAVVLGRKKAESPTKDSAFGAAQPPRYAFLT